MKKGSILAALAVAWTIAGCGSAAEEAKGVPAQPAASPAATTPATEKPRRRRDPVPLSEAKLPAADILDVLLEQNPYTRPFSPPASAWFDADRANHVAVLEATRADVLVVPFQVQGSGFDITQRLLLGADLARAVTVHTGLRVADPFVVARALGEGRRRIAPGEVDALASRLGARTIITAYVGHNDDSQLTLTLQAASFEATVSSIPPTRTTVRQVDRRALPFGDAQPPYVLLHEQWPTLLTELKLPAAQRSATPHESCSRSAVKLPAQPYDPKSKPDSREQAYRLAMLGALGASDAPRAARRLQAKALILQMNASAACRDETLIAYLQFKLGHRPSALMTLGKAADPAASTIRAFANGNLPPARKSLQAVKAPALRTLLDFDLRHLEDKYSDNPEPPAPAESMLALADSSPEWDLLVERRLDDRNPWSVQSNLELKGLLEYVFPVPGLDAIQRAQASPEMQAVLIGPKMHVLAIEHVRGARRLAPEQFCCGSTASDYLDLVESLVVANVIKETRRIGSVQGRREDALARLREIDSLFAGEPGIAYERAVNEQVSASEANFEARAAHLRETQRQWQIVAYWEQQATRQSQNASAGLEEAGNPFYGAYFRDYPARPDLSYGGSYGLGMDYMEQEQLRQRRIREAIAFDIDDMDNISQLDGGEKAQQDAITGRFEGHPVREVLEARNAPAPVTTAEREKALRASIQQRPHVWPNYDQLASLLITEKQDLQAAADVYRQHPEFRQRQGNTVKASNLAQEAGSHFFWIGDFDHALQFYKMAADNDDGSEASLMSQLRIHLLRGEYAESAAINLYRAERYGSSYARRDFIAWLHAAHRFEDGWATFDRFVSDSEDPHVWQAALVGLQAQGSDPARLKEWFARPAIRRATKANRDNAARLALMAYSIDRTPPRDLGQLIAAIEGDPRPFREPNNPHVLVPMPGSERTEVMSPSPLASQQGEPGKPGPFPSRLELFANAYSALRNGDAAAAVKGFDRLAMNYDFEYGEGLRYPYGYYAFAAAKTGDPFKLEQKLGPEGPGHPRPFDFQLALAFFAGLKGDTASATQYLQRALSMRPHTESRPIPTEYQYAEACEWLYRETRHEGYAMMALDWARKHQKLQPAFGWAYAMEARLTKDTDARLRALAMTSYLDPLSPVLNGLSAAQRAEMKNWLEKNNPLAKTFEPPPEPVDETST